MKNVKITLKSERIEQVAPINSLVRFSGSHFTIFALLFVSLALLFFF